MRPRPKSGTASPAAMNGPASGPDGEQAGTERGETRRRPAG